MFLALGLDRAGGLFPPGFSTSAFNQLLMSANPSATGALLQQILSSGMGMGGMGMTPGWSPFPQMGKNLPYPPFWGSNEDKVSLIVSFILTLNKICEAKTGYSFNGNSFLHAV